MDFSMIFDMNLRWPDFSKGKVPCPVVSLGWSRYRAS